MSSVAQMLRQAEALKASVSDSSKTISETWGVRQKLEDIYKKILLIDLEYALDKKVEQELWNHAFKNQITNLQTQAKDKQNAKRAEIQASLNLFLETASGFYLQFLQILCTTFKLDLPFRRKAAYYGILKEKTPVKLKVTPPKKSSCLYVCQHCLVHLGDIARYRQQIDQAQTYYWHAAYLVPFNGQPYNQLAILEAAKGNKLSTVFYYIRSLAVKVPFPVAATNLEKLYAKLTKETPDFKGKLSASEMITGFLQFHALVHLCTDLDKAEELSDKLAAGLPAHVTSQSFPWQVLVQIVAINIFAMNHVAHDHYTDSHVGIANGDSGLTEDEERCFNLVFSLTVLMLDILLQYTPKQEHKVRDYFTLPAVKLLLDWLKLNPHNFDRPVLRFSPLWGNLCKVLNSIQNLQSPDKELDIAKYEELPLPEDVELRCFQPIEKAQSCYSYSRLPADGIPSEAEMQLRCQRLLDHGRLILEEHPTANLSAQPSKSGRLQFASTTPPPQPVAKSVTLVTPSTGSKVAPLPSPEKKSNRQNVAIQAIMQKQAQDKDKPKGKEDPTSPKYLLGVPTSEPPMFFKQGGARTSQNNSPHTQSSPGQGKHTGGQTGGVLVLKNQEHLSQSSGKSVTIQSPKSQQWQTTQRQMTVSSWQPQTKQPQQMKEKPGWNNQQVSPQAPQKGQGQTSPWQQHHQQQQQQPSVRPQLSPQGSQGQWQFPGQQGFSRNDFGPRSPLAPQQGPGRGMPSGPGSVQSPQGPGTPLSLPGYQPQGQGQDTFGQDTTFKGQMMPPGGMMNSNFNKTSPGQGRVGHQGPLQGSSPQGDRFGAPPMPGMGSGEPSLPFGPGHMKMFRHPPPGTRFPPAAGFPNPPPDHHQNSQTNARPGTQPVLGGHNMPSNSNLHGNQSNFSHAPGTERPQGGRAPGHSSQTQQQMPFQHSPFMNPFAGFMSFQNLSNNQMKSPLEGLFGNPRFPQDEIPPNMADIIGTLSKMAIQPPRDNIMPPQRVGPSSFQGHAEGTPKPESYFTQQRSSSVPTVSIDLETKDLLPGETMTPTPPSTVQHQQQQQQSQPQGTYSLFSGSPWLSSGDSKSLGSSPFSSQSSSIRNSPDPSTDSFSADGKLDMGLRFGSSDDRGMKHPDAQSAGQGPNGPFFQNNMQSLWSSQGQSPLERLLELQKQQRQTEPH